MSLPSDQNASGRSFGVEEVEALTRLIEQGTLFAPKGKFVRQLEAEFAEWLGIGNTIACSSGTAAVHAAVAALDLDPGDEIVTTPITDMGALAPLLYQGVIPVFADVNADTGNITPETVVQRISDRTRAVIVTHLFGNPADPKEVAAAAQVPIIEDCAQAFGATVDGERVGTFGLTSTFSLQQGKHITTGEGGLVSTDDENVARNIRLFINKAWDYENPTDHEGLGLNYRMSELQGAVAVAQLNKLDQGVRRRIAAAERLTDAVEGVPGITTTATIQGAQKSYWRFCLLVDREILPSGPDGLASKLSDLGIPSAPRYIKKPAFQTGLFVNKRTFGSSSWPFDLARPEAVDYDTARFPGTMSFLSRVLVIPWNEKLSDRNVDQIADGIRNAVSALVEEAA